MNVLKIETANRVTRIANIDAPGIGKICVDGTTASVSPDHLSAMEVIEYSGPPRVSSP